MQASGRVTVSRVFFFFFFSCSYIEYFKNLTLYPSHTYPISSPEPAFLLVSTKNANLWANPNEATFDWLVKACLFHGPEAIFRREIEI